MAIGSGLVAAEATVVEVAVAAAAIWELQE